MRRAESLVCLLLSTVLPAALAAQQRTIRGRVTDAGSGQPVPGAAVALVGTTTVAGTSENGSFTIDAPAGPATLLVRFIGYKRQNVVVPADQSTVNVSLERDIFTLEAVVVGSRARHTAADELAVPVDVIPSTVLTQQGTTETSQILQAVAPSVNFPHQSVTDATDVVRPFTLRGLSPDHTLVLINGWRRHQTAVVNTFAYGTGAGSSGVDMNTIPSAAIDRIEVLRDGASAQYGSDAIAGVVNLALKEGQFDPFINASAGRYQPSDYDADGRTVDVSGGWGLKVGRGSLGLFAGFLDRQPTNRAWADIFEDAVTGLTDSVNSKGQVVTKNNPVPQPNHHWGDGLERDVQTMANLRLPLNDAGTSELYSFGGYSFRQGTGNGYRRCAADCASFITARSWPQIYPQGYLPEYKPDVTDYSAVGGIRTIASGWSLDLGASFGHNDFKYNLRNTLNVSLGPCVAPAAPCAPGPDSVFATGDEIPNQTSFFAGQLRREEMILGVNASKSVTMGLPAPVNVALGAAFRRERFEITRGELASYVDGNHLGPDSSDGRPYSQVFPGFRPADETDSHRTNVGVYADLETNLSPQFLANVAGRFENYSDFGSLLTGKGAVRYQPSPQLTLRAAASTGFRAPGLGQSHFSHVSTNVIGGQVVDVLISPVSDSAAKLFGAKPLKEEKSFNLSAGFAFSPNDNFTLTVDVFRIRINDRILLGATFDDSVTLAILAANGFSNVGGIQYFTNGLDTRTQGIDLNGDLRVPAGTGTLTFTGAVNYTNNKILRVAPLPAVLDTTATTETGIIDSVTYIGITEERPDWRGTLTAQYERGRVHGLVRASYYGKFSSAQPGFCDLCRERYGSKTLFDAEVGYRFAQVSLALGVRNLFDTYPDQPSSQVLVDAFNDRSMDFNNNFGTFPWAAASPFGYNGRYLYARAEMTLLH